MHHDVHHPSYSWQSGCKIDCELLEGSTLERFAGIIEYIATDIVSVI